MRSDYSSCLPLIKSNLVITQIGKCFFLLAIKLFTNINLLLLVIPANHPNYPGLLPLPRLLLLR